MSTPTLWNALRSKLAHPGTAQRTIALQHLMLSDRDVGTARAVLDKVGEQLDLRFELLGDSGEIVLVDGDLATRVAPQLVQALAEARPVVTIAGLHRGDDLSVSAAELFERRQQELLQQLLAIPLVTHRAAPGGGSARRDACSAPADTARARTVSGPDSGFDSGFDSRFDAPATMPEDQRRGQIQVLRAVLRGVLTPNTAALTASYGPGAKLRFDFHARLVTLDPLALEHLRLRQELPEPAAGTRPQPQYTVRELDLAIWDLGLAAGSLAPLDAPEDWWHAPLLSPPTALVERYTRVPRHREMARRLQAGPVTPSELRRQARVSVDELRSFLQACLLLHLVHWQAPAAPQGAL